MKCPICRAETAAGSSFCSQCGARLASTDAAGGRIDPPGASGGSPGAALVGRRAAADVPEEVLWEGSYSPKAMLGPIVGCALLSVPLLVGMAYTRDTAWWVVPAGLLALVWIALVACLSANRLGIHYKLTNQMFYHERGVFTRTTNRVEAIDIDDVTYKQSLFHRMVNVGAIKISSSDRTDPELWIEGVDDVQQVARTIDKARRAERLRRGVSVESV